MSVSMWVKPFWDQLYYIYILDDVCCALFYVPLVIAVHVRVPFAVFILLYYCEI